MDNIYTLSPAFLEICEKYQKIFNQEPDYLSKLSLDASSISKMLEKYSNLSFPQDTAVTLSHSFPSYTDTYAKIINSASAVSKLWNTNIGIDLNNLSDTFQEFSNKLKESLSQTNDSPIMDTASFDDYVTINEKAVKEWDISESIIIPIGNNRVKMKTSDFIAFLTLVATIILSTIQLSINQFNISNDNQTTQQLIEIEQQRNEIEEERNQILYDFLSSIDTSQSSQAEAIEDLKESVLILHSDLLDLIESHSIQTDDSPTPDSVSQAPEATLDYSQETENSNLE